MWVLCRDETLVSGAPPEIQEAKARLEQQPPRTLADGPLLTLSGCWVALLNPLVDVRSGTAALRRAGAALARKSRSMPMQQIMLGVDSLTPGETAALVEGFRIGWYRYPDEDATAAPELLVTNLTGARLEAVGQSVRASQATGLARMWTEEGPNRLPPERFAELAAKLGRAQGLEVEVLSPEDMRRMGIGGVLAVGEGSVNGPRIVVLRHRPTQTPAIGLVGKGITFDSGGISLKPAENLRKLKGDKAGAAAVLAAALMACERKDTKPFVVILPFAENLPGGDAFRPGDIVTMLDGTTVDVVTTDAEGRMVLADGIGLARSFGCSRVVTLATLTKACIVALGNFRGALYSPDDDLAAELIAAGESTGEFLWRMPLDADYAVALKSTVADLQNSSDNQGAGSIVAAKFIEHFARGITFAHIDMSSIFYLDNEMPWGDKGYTGAGARLMLALLNANDSSHEQAY
jgi:leucyl aminopeptidase